MNINHLSGLQIMQEMCNGNQPIRFMVATIPMSAIEVKLGHVTFLFKANKRHLNPMGSVHDGFATTVLDSVTGCTVFSMLEAGLSYTTIDLNVKMCCPIPLNTELKAAARTLNLSKKLGIAEAQLLDQDSKLYAHATATYMIIR